jgi:DNA-binding NarL/FixJ family response regulator
MKKILLWCDDLMTRVRIESRWKAVGASMLRRDGEDAPDFIVLDLTVKDAMTVLGNLRAKFPEASLIAFGPHVDGDALKAAKAAGASEIVARGAVVDRVLARIEGGA